MRVEEGADGLDVVADVGDQRDVGRRQRRRARRAPPARARARPGRSRCRAPPCPVRSARRIPPDGSTAIDLPHAERQRQCVAARAGADVQPGLARARPWRAARRAPARRSAAGRRRTGSRPGRRSRRSRSRAGAPPGPRLARDAARPRRPRARRPRGSTECRGHPDGLPVRRAGARRGPRACRRPGWRPRRPPTSTSSGRAARSGPSPRSPERPAASAQPDRRTRTGLGAASAA